MKAFVGIFALTVVALVLAFIVVRLIKLLLRVRNRSNDLAPHEELLDAAEDVASASRVAAVVAALAASIAAPAGLLAVLAAFGFVTAPLIVTLAPLLTTAAFVSAGLYGLAKLYGKHRRSKLEALRSPPAVPK